jgi:hypothetical protein
MKIVKFSLRDADGVSHVYEVKLFPVAESVRLQLICAQPLIRAVGKLAATIAPALKSLPGGEGEQEVNIRELLSNVDWEAAPEILTSIPEMVEARGGAQLVNEIFAHTTRLVPVDMLKGQPTIGDKPINPYHPQELKDPAQQEHAFGDGNYLEYWQAAAMVLLVNFTRYGRDGSPSWKTLVGKLTLGVWQPYPTSTETTRPSSDMQTAKPQPSH